IGRRFAGRPFMAAIGADPQRTIEIDVLQRALRAGRNGHDSSRNMKGAADCSRSRSLSCLRPCRVVKCAAVLAAEPPRSMKLGIDFGTSNSAAAAHVEGKVVPVQFGDALQFRTTVYFPEVMRDPNDFALTPALEQQLEELIESGRRASRAAGTNRSHDQLRSDAMRVVRRQWMEERIREP